MFRSIESATAFSKLRGNPYVELVHCIQQMLQIADGDLHRIVRHAGIERETLDRDLTRALKALPAGSGSILDFSHHVETAIERAWVLATLAFQDRLIRGAWLIAAIVTTPELRRVLLAISPEFASIPVDGLKDALRSWIDGSPEANDLPHDGSDLTPSIPGEASNALKPPTRNVLDRYCTDLTALARAGELDAVIGRDEEIRTVVDVLLRRRQNNPLLTGEAGVGKTAVVEGLAIAIAAGEASAKLADTRLLSLDVGALLAGASMKGEFEARLKDLLEAASKSHVPIILFVDEIHTLVGAGGQAGTGDAANLLKPALARGAVRMIGATTWSEYKRHIEKDPALTRRFQMLQVCEPEESAAIDMVRGLAPTFSRHHGVIVRDEAIRAAVTLSHRYLPSRQLPDKAISLLDTACARVALSQHTPPHELQNTRQRLQAACVEYGLLEQEARIGFESDRELSGAQSRIDTLLVEQSELEARWHTQTAAVQALIRARETALDASSVVHASGSALDDDSAAERLQALLADVRTLQGETPLVFPDVDQAVVAEIVSDWTGIPVGRMITDEIAAVQTLSDILASRVTGQPDALAQISERVRTARAGLADPKKPLGVFLLAGPSGVGKTETALALAQTLYGGEQNLITINLSEYQEAHTVSGLKGAPPGYVGYGEGGVLTEAVRRRPYSVVLLDEIEKAHRDVHEIFFQVFDKGYMEDGDGRFIDFRNTIILLTSNAGAEMISSMCDRASPAPDHAELRAALTQELLGVFPAAFLGRIAVVPYRPLTHAALVSIVRLHLDRVVQRMDDAHAIELGYDVSVADYIVGQCVVGQTGARALIDFIDQHVLPRLSALWLDALAANRRIAGIRIGTADDRTTPCTAITFDVTDTDAAADRSGSRQPALT